MPRLPNIPEFSDVRRRNAFTALKTRYAAKEVKFPEYRESVKLLLAREASAIVSKKALADKRAAAAEVKKAEAKATKATARAAAKAAKEEAKRTYLVAYSYTRERRRNELVRGQEVVRDIPLPEEAPFSSSFALTRNKGERMNAFMSRAETRAREEIESMNTQQVEAFLGGETFFEFKYVRGSLTVNTNTGSSSKMTRPKPWAYEGSDFYSIAEEGRCVPKSLETLYPSMDYWKIVADLGMADDTEPCSMEQVLAFCVKNDITCIGCDDEYNVIVRNITRNRNKKPLYFVSKDTHFYVMDKSRGISILYSSRNDRPMKTKEAKMTTQKEQTRILVSSQEQLDYSVKDTHYIVNNAAQLRGIVGAYMATHHKVPKMYFGTAGASTIFIKSFIFGNNNKISFDPQHKIVEKASALLGIEVGSLSTIASSLKDKMIPDLPKSFMNEIVFDIFKSWKQRQHYAHLMTPEAWESVDGVEQAWDANKQYTAALRNAKHNWLVFDMYSLPRAYSGSVGDCYYFVKTSNTMPCKGNGWYSRSIVEYLIKYEIPHNVLYEIPAASTLPNDYFVSFVDEAVAMAPEGFKYITNTFVGSLNTHENKKAKVSVSSSKEDILAKCFSTDAHFVDIKAGNDSIYAAAMILKTWNCENNMPMYSQILDYAAVQLALGIKHLEDKGCRIRSYNTDSITFKAATVLPIDVSTAAIGGWKSEEPKPFTNKHSPKCSVLNYKLKPLEWSSDMTETDFSSCDAIVEHLVSGSTVLEGGAGFGKSYVIEKVVEKIGAENCVVLGYTNISANNIGGSTFHKTFKIKLEDYTGSKSVASILKDKQMMIIDEISQTPAKLYKIIEEAVRLGVKVLISGDFKQILPIGFTGDADSASDILKLLCGRRVVMTKYKRGDAELLAALSCVRERKSVPFRKGEKGALWFCFTKAMRDTINVREMAKVKTGVHYLPKNTNISKVYVGLPLRSRITKENGDWLNGERWRITSIEYTGGNRSMTIVSTQRGLVQHIDDKILLENFTPGYAMTVHSSQGLTITEPYTVCIQYNTAFSNDDVWRMIYTATSRAKSIDQVGLVFSA